jgi:SSS family solute:Na+ symporter
MLALLALLGYVALAAGIQTKDTSAVVPLLFLKMFPESFAGFCLAAIAIGALVPAAIMSIAIANLFTRNLVGEFRREKLSDRAESSMAKLVSLAAKFGALAFVLGLPTGYAIQMQLLGGIWICQVFPAVVGGLFTRWLNPWALLCGWAAGMGAGTWMAAQLALKSSVYPLHVGGGTYGMYAAVPALGLNLVVAVGGTMVLRGVGAGSDETGVEDYA